MKLKDIKISDLNVRELGEEHDLSSLVGSIKKFDLLSKIVLREKEDTFEVIAGQRRVRALTEIYGEDYELPSEEYVIRNDLEDWDALLLSIDENQQRVELSPLELNRAARKLNSLNSGVSSKDLAKILNITPYRLKRILSLSEDRSRIPEVAIEELKKTSSESKFNDAHWEKIRNSDIMENPEVVKDVVDYIMDKECPPRDVPSIIKAVSKGYEQKGSATDTSSAQMSREECESSEGPLEYKHRGQVTLEEHGDEKILRVLGKGEDEEIPINHYLNYIKNSDKFKCYVTFSLKIKPVLD